MAQNSILEALMGKKIAPVASHSDEESFQRWYQRIAQQQGLDPNADDPRHLYDYREAFRNGAFPDATGHWPSTWKMPGHPQQFVDGRDTRTGVPALAPRAPLASHTPDFEPIFKMNEIAAAPRLQAEPMTVPGVISDADVRGLEGMVQGMSGVTKFVQPGGVVDVAARKAASKANISQLAEWIKYNMGIDSSDVAEAQKMYDIAQKYPRVMAHVADIRSTQANDAAAGKFKSMTWDKAGKTGMISLNPSMGDQANTFAHELTHAAQKIGLGNEFDPMYNAITVKMHRAADEANRQAGMAFGPASQQARQTSYWWNPFEMSARYVADKKAPILGMPSNTVETKPAESIKSVLQKWGVDWPYR